MQSARRATGNVHASPHAALPEQRVADTNRVPKERVSTPSRETTHPQVEVEIRPSRTRRRTWRGLLREIIGEHHHAIH